MIPDSWKRVAEGLRKWEGCRAMACNDVVVWLSELGFPEFCFKGPALQVERKIWPEPVRARGRDGKMHWVTPWLLNNYHNRADISLQGWVGLDVSRDSRGILVGGAGQTLSEDTVVHTDDLFASGAISSVLRVALGMSDSEHSPGVHVSPSEAEPWEGRPTEYYSAKAHKVFKSSKPRGLIHLKPILGSWTKMGNERPGGEGLDFCQWTSFVDFETSPIVGVSRGHPFFVTRTFGFRDKAQMDSTIKHVKACGGMLFPSFAVADVPAANYGWLSLYAPYSLVTDFLKPNLVKHRGSVRVVTYSTDSWTETSSTIERLSLDLFKQMTCRTDMGFGEDHHFWVLGPVMRSETGAYELKIARTTTTLDTMLAHKRKLWTPRMSHDRIEQLKREGGGDQYPYLETKVNGIVRVQDMLAASFPISMISKAKRFLKAIGFKGKQIGVNDTQYPYSDAGDDETWRYSWGCRNLVLRREGFQP